MRRPWLLALLLVVGITATAVPRPETTAAQPPADPDGLAVVRAAYEMLLGQFYRPLDGRALLAAGWTSLTATAAGAAMPAPPPLPPLPDDPAAAFDTFRAAYGEYMRSLPADVKPVEAAFIVVAGMARSVKEGHTQFLAPQEYRDFLAQVGGAQQPIGLGLTTTTRAPWVVRAVAPDGPAARAGVERGDVIVAVDGRTVTDASPRQFAEAVGGAAGVTHHLSIERRGETLEVTVTRGAYFFPPLESGMLAGDVGYLRIDSFPVSGVPLANGSEFLTDFDRRLAALDAAGARALILDLRGNPGGLVFTAAEVLGRFLPEDALTSVYTDERGRQVTGLAGGLMHPVQLPMVVLINGETASAAELVAAVLREHNRAILVGERSAGLLASALLQPLPEGAGLYVAVAEVLTAGGRRKIDGAGIAPDVAAPAPSADDERMVRDPQLDAALVALAQAPPPPSPRSVAAGRTADELRAAFARLMPEPGAIPTNERLTTVGRLSTRAFTHVNQWINYNGPARDPLAVQAALRARGWQGSYVQEYGRGLQEPPGLSVIADLYATSDGAAAAIRANDLPEFYEAVPSPAPLGDESVAYRGVWLGQGMLSVVWRRDTVVYSVGYLDVPGQERWDTALAVARLVDAAHTDGLLRAVAPPLDAGLLVP